jgi:hypothetical protein
MRFAVRHANEHETATANISGRRMDDGQSKAGGHGRVNGISSDLQDFYTHL